MKVDFYKKAIDDTKELLFAARYVNISYILQLAKNDEDILDKDLSELLCYVGRG